MLTCGLGRVADRRDIFHNRLIYQDKIMLDLGRRKFRENAHIQNILSSTTAQTALSAKHAPLACDLGYSTYSATMIRIGVGL